MKNNIAFSNTLEALKRRYQLANAQVVLIMKAQRALEDQTRSSKKKIGIVYEAYLLQTASDNSTVKGTGRTIHSAYKKSVSAWKKQNWRSELSEVPSAEVFALIGNVRIAIMPEDAHWITKQYEQFRMPKGTFGLCSLISKFPNAMVFRPGDPMPGWYEESWLGMLNGLKAFGESLTPKKTSRKKY